MFLIKPCDNTLYDAANIFNILTLKFLAYKNTYKIVKR